MQHVKNILMKKISKIKKINNKYTIILSDNSSLSFYSDTLIKYNLLKPREISDKELEEVINYNNYIEAYNKALTYISYKQRTKKEIKDKLCNYSIDVIDKVIKKLDELSLLDEKKYIEAFINDQINLGNKGPFYIKKELKKLNINIDYIDEILNNINEDVWIEKVKKIVDKKINTNKKLPKERLLLKIKNDLILLGYSKNIIDKVLSNIIIEEDSEVIEMAFDNEYKRLSKKYKDKELEKKVKYNLYKKGFSLEGIEEILNKRLDYK